MFQLSSDGSNPLIQTIMQTVNFFQTKRQEFESFEPTLLHPLNPTSKYPQKTPNIIGSNVGPNLEKPNPSEPNPNLSPTNGVWTNTSFNYNRLERGENG